jgi:hypothetical protein
MSLLGRVFSDHNRFCAGILRYHEGLRVRQSAWPYTRATVLVPILAILTGLAGNIVHASDMSANAPNSSAADPINSQHFEFEGRCRGSGKDMVYTWNGGEGNIPPPDQFGKSFIYPWLDTDILVRGVELVVLSPWWFVDWLAVGNNTWGDFMLLLGHGESHAAHFYPGTAFRFPGKSKMTPLTYIDLHGSCWHPFKARVFLELYYTQP